jgi:hypothetical protein
MKIDQIDNAIEILKRVLTEIGWTPEPIEDGAFQIDFGPPYLPISTGLAAIARDAGQFVLYLNFGFFVAHERRDEVLRLIARANWGLIIGSFELDLDDGHLRFKSSLDFDGTELNDDLISNAVLGAIRAVEAHASALMQLIPPSSGIESVNIEAV